MPAELTSRFPQIIASLPGEVDEALRETADAVVEGAKGRVPVRTGALRDAIHVEQIEGGYSVVAGDGGDVYYGHIVEGGSAVGGKGRPPVPPHPFMTPAAEAERADHFERVNDALESL